MVRGAFPKAVPASGWWMLIHWLGMLSEEITGVCGENSGGFHRILQILSVETFIEKEMVQKMLATELECTEKTMEWDWVRPPPPHPSGPFFRILGSPWDCRTVRKGVDSPKIKMLTIL